MIATLDDELNPLKNKTYVAVDSVGAGINDVVLAEEYFALNKRSLQGDVRGCHC